MTATTEAIINAAQSISSDYDHDALFAILADQQRRLLLTTLTAAESPQEISTLAQRIADAPESEGVENADWLRINLYHCHIPRLAEAGLVTWSKTANTVRLTDAGHTIAMALDS
jgi:predicted ArsR family transcriptional regulator